METNYKAPWSKKLKNTTGFFAVLLIAAFFIMDSLAASVLLVLILIVSLLMVVRGFNISDGKLSIHRLGWTKNYDVTNLKKAEYSPNITLGSIRSFGAGGFFGYVGKFKNKVLGNFVAYVTDEQNSVVLEFSDKTLVVSPDEPENFVTEIERVIKSD